jgi:hypothetical protein
VDLLKDLLKWGGLPVKECKKTAADAGILARTVERAARQLGVIVSIGPDYMGGRLFKWELPKKDGEVTRCVQSLAETVLTSRQPPRHVGEVAR